MTTGDVALVVAGYAALVSTGSLGWQVYVRLQQLEPRIAVSVRHAGPFGRMMVESSEHPPRPSDGRMPLHEEYELIVSVVNRGETTEVVEAIGIDPPARPGEGRRDPPFWFHERNESLGPGDAIKHAVPVAHLVPGSSGAGLEFVAYAALASGSRIEALPDRVEPDFVRLSDLNRPPRLLTRIAWSFSEAFTRAGLWATERRG